ncbi:hypothetical protein [Chryseobacterium sp. 5_R23647]|uniref:hypothetical protein n=1 Tax=Chryseobacterium sp. 5_R23647 TaxID=2258964 RepID=UPI000E224C70|nr:hypothetical protein [Chryseobacterium sp. 5_R23647]REC40513.1 hypothetical protein DRF69_18640 [Chryseobacterium sp. 5_R23647]
MINLKNRSKLTDVEFDKLATLFKDNDFVINVLRMKFLDFTDKQKQQLFAFLMPFVSDYIKIK